MSYTDNSEQGKLSNRDLLIIIGTILALIIAGVVITRIVMADQPYSVNEPPKNVVGTSEKMQYMRQEQQMQAPAQGGQGGGGIGDDIDPTKMRKQ